MQGYKNYQDTQEEVPVEETITVSLEENQKMREEVTSMERLKERKRAEKFWLIARIHHIFISKFCSALIGNRVKKIENHSIFILHQSSYFIAIL